jgi:hypothetical protein
LNFDRQPKDCPYSSIPAVVALEPVDFKPVGAGVESLSELALFGGRIRDRLWWGQPV